MIDSVKLMGGSGRGIPMDFSDKLHYLCSIIKVNQENKNGVITLGRKRKTVIQKDFCSSSLILPLCCNVERTRT